MTDEATEVFVLGKQLICPICGQGRFETRRTVMTPNVFGLFRFESTRTALNQICVRCGHILCFLERPT